LKIAILTLPIGENYGGIMQAWALQTVLKKMGHEPVTIDRQPDARGLAYRSARIAYRAVRNAIGSRKGPVLRERVLPTVTKYTREFIRTNITMSPPLDSTEKLRAHFADAGYDAVIVGSDQTWRPPYSPNIYNYFLDFLPDRKIKKLAYASSFGVDHWEFSPQQTRKCAALARDFDFISVRENSGIKLCADHLGVTAETALDPTLLLSADDYRALIAKHQHNRKTGGGIYTYILDKTRGKNDVVQRLSNEINLPIFNYQANTSLANWTGGSIEQYIMPPVTEWLSGFDCADFVVTDSFHGMVFAIIFGKPFIAISNPARGAARFDSLLSQIGLSDRLVLNSQAELTSSIREPLPSAYLSSISAIQRKSLLALEMQLQ
jgi:polysaccharide pyruvyl transferase WcaK-like protein